MRASKAIATTISIAAMPYLCSFSYADTIDNAKYGMVKGERRRLVNVDDVYWSFSDAVFRTSRLERLYVLDGEKVAVYGGVFNPDPVNTCSKEFFPKKEAKEYCLGYIYSISRGATYSLFDYYPKSLMNKSKEKFDTSCKDALAKGPVCASMAIGWYKRTKDYSNRDIKLYIQNVEYAPTEASFWKWVGGSAIDAINIFNNVRKTWKAAPQ